MITFSDKYHFKNYVRKICQDFGISKENFDNNYADIFYKIYDFEKTYYAFLSYHHFDLTVSIVKRIKEFNKQQLYNLTYLFENTYTNLLKEIEDVSTRIKEHNDYRRNIISNYNIDLFDYKVLHFIASSQNKFIAAYKGYSELSKKFIQFINQNEWKIGLYFLYDENKVLKYIGKSINLGSRILDSIKERGAFYVSIAYTKTKSDMHVYEAYYITKEKPLLNTEFNEKDSLTIKLKKLKKTPLLKIYTE